MLCVFKHSFILYVFVEFSEVDMKDNDSSSVIIVCSLCKSPWNGLISLGSRIITPDMIFQTPEDKFVVVEIE